LAIGIQTIYRNGTNVVKKGDAVMAAMNDAANVEVILSRSIGQEGFSDRNNKERRNK
jgi:hypothetical protein